MSSISVLGRGSVTAMAAVLLLVLALPEAQGGSGKSCRQLCGEEVAACVGSSCGPTASGTCARKCKRTVTAACKADPDPGRCFCDVTGRWEAVSTRHGVAGALLTHAGKRVTGSVFGSPLRRARLAKGRLKGRISVGAEQGRLRTERFHVRLLLAADCSGLAGTVRRRGSDPTPFSFTRMSNEPVEPDPTPPVVVETIPSDGATGVGRTGLALAMRWSKPVVGWAAVLSGPINGQHTTLADSQLVDEPRNVYDPGTDTFTMHLRPEITLDPNATYTWTFDNAGEPDGVDWHDAYGAPAWPDERSAGRITFTTGP